MLRKLFFLCLLLSYAHFAHAVSPAAYCRAYGVASCGLVVSANQGITVEIFTGISGTGTFSDTLGLTWHQVRCDQNPFSSGNQRGTWLCAYWARTGANSGIDIVTFSVTSPAFSRFNVEAWNSTDIDVVSPNPVDSSFATSGTLVGIGGGSYVYAGGNITTAQANEIVTMTWTEQDDTYSSSQGGHGQAGTHLLSKVGLGTSDSDAGYGGTFFTTGCIQTCGSTPVYALATFPAGTYSTMITMVGINFYTGIMYQVVAWKPGTAVTAVHHQAQII